MLSRVTTDAAYSRAIFSRISKRASFGSNVIYIDLATNDHIYTKSMHLLN